MDIRKLEALCRVVELKSFTRAAEVMLLSQPTVSEHIRSLEEELGQKLVDRLGREVEATPAGRLLHGYALKMLRIRHEAEQALEQFSGRMVGRVTFGCSTIPGTYILPGLIGKFRELYPAIHSTLRIASSRLIAGKVMSGDLEFGVIGAKWNENSLVWTEIFGDELTLAVSPDHPFARRGSVTLQEIVTEPCVIREPESGTRKVVAQILESQGFKESDLQEVAEMGSTAAVKEAVKAGVGVAILSRLAVSDEIGCGKLVAVTVREQSLQRPFYLIQRRNRALSPVASVFIHFLQEQDALCPPVGDPPGLVLSPAG